ncbi:unnamed protein product [Adineta steineri]|uniref:Uncharacterized protein n=1 Tax=Adineta steineri TaxID=433720 RepID=A0A814IG21_9BILA|nr:unnamed protein product [Adineta steineri]CAF1130222.1 unnamed protein product [Adineta steineri]
MINHFTTTSADDCTSTIVFKPILPQTILKPDHSASSFLTLAPYGTGKTLLRCEYYKSLQSDTYFKLLILNRYIDEYLQRFVDTKAMSGTDCDKESCIMKWSSNEFGQLLLSRLVTQFVETFEKESLYLPSISSEQTGRLREFFSGENQQIKPKIDGINMDDGIIRKDKFPILEINWNLQSIINYADYVLQETNKNTSPFRCKSFVDFKTLVNYSNPKNAEIINQISTPRILHYFMQHLITEMNHCANVVKEPFIATTENIYTAYEKAAKSTFKVHFINK